ncbi:MAG: hypothetical protein AAF317_19860, partial [Pseudomonadota bacterium]
LGTEIFVYLATGAQVLGLLVTRQLILRLLVLIGSGLFIVYYFTHLGQPQWEAIIGSSLIASANLIGLLVLLYSRLPIGLRGEERMLFDAIGGLEPGQFRRIMRVGRMIQTPGQVELTCEGEKLDELYFVLEGRPKIDKGSHAFRIADKCFVGEVAYKLGCPASATATLPEGGTYVRWQKSSLEAVLAGNPMLKQAFDALISRDMARKIAVSTHMGCLETSRSRGRLPLTRIAAFRGLGSNVC